MELNTVLVINVAQSLILDSFTQLAIEKLPKLGIPR